VAESLVLSCIVLQCCSIQDTHNPLVEGSSPSRPTKKIKNGFFRAIRIAAKESALEMLCYVAPGWSGAFAAFCEYCGRVYWSVSCFGGYEISVCYKQEASLGWPLVVHCSVSPNAWR
jgi:hypothetical protein